jgi:UDP-N-acetylglucosamine 2-epimerase (non-hydrolysing)
MAASNSIAVVLGTRPEIIKMSPIIRECRRRRLELVLIHSEQHRTYEMDRVFFEELELPAPGHRLGVGQGTHGEQTGRLLQRIEKVLIDVRPRVVLVQGDTNTVLGGALAAAKLNISVGHVEAGLRSYDRRMPEELNRVLADHAADVLFAPTKGAEDILLGEGIAAEKIHVTGNTIVDAVQQNLEIARKRCDPLTRHGLSSGSYIVLTAHRPENVDDASCLEQVLASAQLVRRRTGLPVIYPLHPRTESMLRRFGMNISGDIQVVDPLGFLEFLQLEAQAALILTDSGGMQEEACILKVPCVTLRNSTERPETVAVGANLLVGIQPQSVWEGVQQMLGRNGGWTNPFGDGSSGSRIVELIAA